MPDDATKINLEGGQSEINLALIQRQAAGPEEPAIFGAKNWQPPIHDVSTKPGRNHPCYCGSGKKYKLCHLPLDEKARLAPAPSLTQEPDEPSGAFNLPDFSGGPRAFKNISDVSKLLAGSGLAKHDPEFRRIFNENKTLLAYLAREQEIEDACEKLEPYEEEFRKFLNEDEPFMRRIDELFAEESFVDLRFTAADVERAFRKVGFPPEHGPEEEVRKIFRSGMSFLASKEHRNHLAMELLLRMPKYVEEGRFIDARLLTFLATETVEEPENANPFLLQMFFYGLAAWSDEQEKGREALLREVGFDPTKTSPDEIDAWLAEQAADPAKTARLQQLLDSHPDSRDESSAMLSVMNCQAVDLLEREDAACILLPSEEIESWTPFLKQTLDLLSEKYDALARGAELSEAQQEEVFCSIFLPAMREMATGIFTPQRIRKLVGDLKIYRSELFAAGEKNAALCATGAINHIEREDAPSQNFFLIILCYRSIRGLGSGTVEDADGNDPAYPSATE